MPGAISASGHDGFRSENLATLIFSSWGTVIPTPTPEDFGVDLHCTLVDRVGKRAWARSPYTVQVKSTLDPWVFDGAESVRWLIEHPLPLFLCVVDRSTGTVRVYHTAPRFYVWALGSLPERVTLIPKIGTEGHCTQWTESHEYSLGAPILELSLKNIGDDDYWKNARSVMELWIEADNNNLTLIRAGLLRFRMPDPYRTNDPHIGGMAEQGLSQPSKDQLRLGVVHLAECLNCIGTQFHYSGNRLGAIEAGLLYRHLKNEFPQFFDKFYDRPDSAGGFFFLFHHLTEIMQGVQKDYVYAGIEELERRLVSVLPSLDPKDLPSGECGAAQA